MCRVVMYVVLSFFASTLFASDILRVPGQYGSIQSAINAAVDGDTVLVSPGTYVEQIAYSKNIDLRSTDGPRATIIECDTRGFGGNWGPTLSTSATSSVIDGFTITGGDNVSNDRHQVGGGVRSYGGVGVIIRNCIIRNNNATYGGGVGFIGPGGGNVENSVIEYNTAGRGGGTACMTEDTSVSSNIYYRNTIFRYNSASTGGAISGGYIPFSQTPPLSVFMWIYNSTIIDNICWGVQGGAAVAGGWADEIDFYIYNSIIRRNFESGVLGQFTWAIWQSMFIEYSNVEGGYPGGGNIDADPLFLDIEAGNYHLQPNSPCIDAGNNARVARVADYAFTWQPRHVDYWAVADTGNRVDERAVVDMGAYEFQGDCNGNRFNDTSESLGPFPGSGSALAFDGIDDYARVAMIQPMIRRESTVEFWQYAEEYRNQSSFGIADCNSPGANRIQAHVPWGDKTVYFDHGDLSTQSYARVTNSPDVVFTDLAGLWIHWAFVIDPGTNTTTIYRNGEAIQQNSAWGTFNGDANTPLIIGGMGDPVSGCQLFPFRGVIDEFRIWEVAHDGAQIRSLMNQELIGNEGGLIAYYPFSEGMGTTSANMCLNAVQDDAVLMNGVSWYSAADSDTNGNWIPDDCDPNCAADLNGDGELNFFDVSAFLSAYSASDPAADFNGDGVFNFFDVSAFLSAFAAGCP